MSLRNKLIISNMLVIAVVGGTAFSMMIWQINQAFNVQVKDQQKKIANYALQLVNLYFDRTKDNLNHLAEDPTIIEALEKKEPEKVQQVSEKLTVLISTLENIGLHEVIGSTCIARSADKPALSVVGTDFSSRDYCRGIIQTQAPYLSSVFVSAVSQKPVLGLAVPVRNNSGKMIGYVLGIVDLQKLRNSLLGLQEHGSFVVLFDRYSTRFLDTRENIQKLDDSGKAAGMINKISESADQKCVFCEYRGNFISSLKTDSLTIAVGESAAHLFYRSRALLLIVILISFLAIVLLILLLIIIIRRPTRRLAQLAKTAEIFGQGKLSVRINQEDLKEKDEIGVLGGIFNDMAGKLQDLYRGLEEKIKERTGELAEAKAKSEAILTSIGDGVVACDKNGIIIMFNNIAEELTGFDAREAIGKHYGKVLKFSIEGSAEVSEDFIAKIIKTGIPTEVNHRAMIVRKDGQKIPVSAIMTSIKDAEGNTLGSVSVLRNVAKEREIDRIKTEFVSVASHQLRSPLTAISWLLEILKRKETGSLSAKQQKLLQDIYQSTDRMIDLVNDLLNVSRLESGILAITPELTQLEDVILKVIQDENLLIQRKKCRIVFKKSKKQLPTISLDRSLITQAFHNLLTNAVRYSKDGSQVEVKLEKRAEDFLLTVSDEGIGIPRDKQRRIFEKFFRAENAQKMHPDGTGLGLYITKIIIESAGGKIWFASKEGRGTKFFIVIPITGMKERAGGG